MIRPFARVCIAAPVLLAPPSFAITIPQDRSFDELDPPIRSELMELGGYQELVMEFTAPTLVEVPLFSHSSGQLEFRDAALRVRVEAQPFDHPKWVKKVGSNWQLEGRYILGWSPGEVHTRLGRVEVVVDGCVSDLPAKAWLDVFDPPLRRDGLPFAAVMRSRDERRIYVHLQSGDAADARMVTWVFEDGAYLYRVVDPLP